MALISVDRKPTILGFAEVFLKYGENIAPALMSGFSSIAFDDQSGNPLPANLRFYSVTVNNESGTGVLVRFDSLTGSTSPLGASSLGFTIDALGEQTFDVSTLLGVTGVRRILLYPLGGSYSGGAQYLQSTIRLLATFYTPQQSA